MKAKIEGNKLTFEISEFVETLDENGKREMGRALVADKHLFAAVLDCVSKGEFFEDCDSGSPWWFGRETVLELREKLIPLLKGVARSICEEALRQKSDAKADLARTSKWAWSLYHAWPSTLDSVRPSIPSFIPSPLGADGKALDSFEEDCGAPERIALWLEDRAARLSREFQRGGHTGLEAESISLKCLVKKIREGEWREPLPVKRLGDH